MASPTEEMGDDPGSAPFVLTAIGLVITLNRVRAAMTWTAFARFLAALVALWSYLDAR